jgi:type VI secretion system protein ImpG
LTDDLLSRYQDELSLLRALGAEFAETHPKIAARLLLEKDRCQDPHVERLLQGTAFLAARVRAKIEDGYPEIVESFLNVLYPHYLAPTPARTIVQFDIDPDQGRLTEGCPIPRETKLLSNPVDGVRCRFRTCFPVTLWPIKVSLARFETADARELERHATGTRRVLRMKLEALGGLSFADLTVEDLRFYLSAEFHLASTLYEMLCNNVKGIIVKAPAGPAPAAGAKQAGERVILDRDSIHPVGFQNDEGILPYPKRSFLGYRLLQEYFVFPEKFIFLDIRNLGCLRSFGKEVELLFLMDAVHPAEQSFSAANFLLGCAPAVNLFDKLAEPIGLDHVQSEYRVIPDLQRDDMMEVYSVDNVHGTAPHIDREPIPFEPFYSFRHGVERDEQRTFWVSRRQASVRKKDRQSEVYLSLVNLDFDPTLPDVETLIVRVTCSNGNLPAKLPPLCEFEMEVPAPVRMVRSVIKPLAPERPQLGGANQWRLISHLCLNHLSIGGSGKEQDAEALRELLSIYNFNDSADTRKVINGIRSIRSRNIIRRISIADGSGFTAGTELTVEFDESEYVGAGLYLFASVLERFFGLYVGINSFTEFVAWGIQRRGVLRRWSARIGNRPLV